MKKLAWIAVLILGIMGTGIPNGVLYSHAAKAKPRAKKESEEKASKQEVLLIAGLQSTYDIPFKPCMTGGNYDECLRITNKSLVTVQYAEQKSQLIFTPLKKGETTVVIRDDGGDIRIILNVVISESNLVRRVKELKDLLKDIEGVEIKVVADKIVVDGEVVVVQDLNRLYAVLSDGAYKDIVMNLVTVSPMGLKLFAEKMQTEINNQAIKVRTMNGMFILEGQVESADQKDLALKVAKGMISAFTIPMYALNGPNNPIDVRRATTKDPIEDRISISPKKPDPPAKMIRVTVDFVELSKDYLRNFGFSWIPSLSGDGGSMSFGQSTTGGITSSGNGSLSGTISGLFPKLSTAQNAGYARVLEESVLIVKANEKAELNRTLQVPVEVQTIQPNGAVTKTYNPVSIGPEMTIVPSLKDQNENVELSIDIKYNGFAGKSATAPIILNHLYKSVVIVKNNESAAVVNAISNTVSTAFNKDPPGGFPSNPLFTLLRSKAFQKNKSQFVIFLTPQIIDSASNGTEDIKQRYGLKRKPAAE